MTNKNSIILLLAMFLSIGFSANAQKTALLYAEELYEKELIDSAIYHFEVALGQNPSNFELQQRLAGLYQMTNRPAKASALYEQLIKSPKTGFQTWFDYAYTLKMEGKYDKSRSILMQLKSHSEVVGNGPAIQLIEYNIVSCDFALENKSKIPAFHKIANEKTINSTASEFSPFLIGNQVYYASNRIINNVYGDPNSFSDPNSDYIFTVARKSLKELLKPTLLHNRQDEKFVSDAADLAPLCFSSDAKRMVSSSNSFSAGLRHPFSPGNGRIFQLSIAELASVTDLPKLKKIEFANTAANVQAGFPFLSNDGKSLYFASNGKGLEINYGGFDLYVSYFVNGEWTSPKNLGATVNGPSNEVSPFIDDEGILYFASDGHKGFGGFDIFRSESSGTNWTGLRNLGFGINSSSDDLYFVYEFANEVAYFCSNRSGGSGDYDIYSAIKLGDLSMMPKVIAEEPKNLASSEKIVPEIKEIKTDIVSTESKTLANPNGKSTETKKIDDQASVDKTKKIDDQASVDKTKKIDELAASEKTKTETNTLNRLPCADNVYIGAISDGSTKQRIEEVWVYVKNMSTGEERKVKTSKYGEYSIILDSQTQYEIRCSRQGYENYTFDIFTGDGEKRTLLSERTMARAVTNTLPVELMVENGLVARGVTANTETFVRGPQEGKAIPTAGYQIQVGVFKDINQTTQKELANLANIITEPYKDGSAKIYRLGIFADELHAKDILSKVQGIVGLEKSFIKKVDLQNRTTSDRMNSDLMLVYPKYNIWKEEKKETVIKKSEDPKKGELNIEKEPKKTDTIAVETKILEVKKTETEVKTDNSVKKESGKADIKIQLGAYKDPSKAQLPDLSELGTLEMIRIEESGLTCFYLSGYKTLDEARKALSKAKEKGVEKPFIVAFKNGKKVDLSEVEK